MPSTAPRIDIVGKHEYFSNVRFELLALCDGKYRRMAFILRFFRVFIVKWHETAELVIYSNREGR